MLENISRDRRERVDLKEQLLQAQKMDAVGQLAGGIAHDFNNLLSVIIGYSDFVKKGLQEGAAAEAVLRDVEEIKSAAVRATSLTGQLLAFSRRQVLQPVVMNLNTSVSRIEKMLRRVIGEHVYMQTNLGGALGRVKADPGQIEVVIMNLVVNARDAMPNGGTITLETSNVVLDESSLRNERFVARSGPYILLKATDTGTGMSAETKSKIFEPFFTTKEKGKGTGLGLSTVYGIVKQSGGYIWVESEPGHGSSFEIYLPMVDDAVSPIEAERLSLGTHRGSETILIVEDEEKIRLMVMRLLQENAYTVLCAVDGPEAFALCQNRENTIDLVLSDIVMPGMSGPDSMKRLRQIRPDLRVLYMSGYTDHAIFRDAIPEIGNHFLMKPFTSASLVSKIRSTLDLRDVAGLAQVAS